VVATARNASSLSYMDEFGDKALKLSLDVNSGESVDKALAATLDKFGRIDVLVNNAGYGMSQGIVFISFPSNTNICGCKAS
jgi:NADP-dependent 3-hydroxy acid dehydrogenase YdfG